MQRNAGKCVVIDYTEQAWQLRVIDGIELVEEFRF